MKGGVIGQAQTGAGARVQQVPVVPGYPGFPVYQLTPEQLWTVYNALLTLFFLLLIIGVPIALVVWYIRKK